jgi:hypothetical protein
MEQLSKKAGLPRVRINLLEAREVLIEHGYWPSKKNLNRSEILAMCAIHLKGSASVEDVTEFYSMKGIYMGHYSATYSFNFLKEKKLIRLEQIIHENEEGGPKTIFTLTAKGLEMLPGKEEIEKIIEADRIYQKIREIK